MTKEKDMILEIIELEKVNQEKIIADLNKGFKFMYDNIEHCRHSCRPFVECPAFKIMPVDLDDCD